LREEFPETFRFVDLNFDNLATLADGYLPILQVAYTDRAGVRYLEESFVGRLPGGRSLVSFIRLTADAGRAERAATIRFVSSRGARHEVIAPGNAVELDAALVHGDARLERIAASEYAAARSTVSTFWQRSLADTPSFIVPESRVMDAERALEIEELEMTWRYSVGNAYEELSYAEALDVAQVMAGYGYGDVARQISALHTEAASNAIHELARGRASRSRCAVLPPRP